MTGQISQLPGVLERGRPDEMAHSIAGQNS